MVSSGKLNKSFQFSSEQLEQLHEILGSSDEVDKYLDKVRVLITHQHKEKHNYGSDSKSKILARLEQIEKKCSELIEVGSIINIDTKGDAIDLEKDWRATLMIEALPILGRDFENREAYPGFVSDFFESVFIMKQRCRSARARLGPTKRGDSSGHEILLQAFENKLVAQYRLSFNCCPAKTAGGAFHRAMNKFYRAAGYTESNSYQRVCRAINRYLSDSGYNNRMPEELKPKRGLHPNK